MQIMIINEISDAYLLTIASDEDFILTTAFI